jgi:hypothetical protein
LSVFILSAVRTPLGALGGGLRTLSGPALGALVIRAAWNRLGTAPIGEVIMGCAFQAGMGPNPARRAALAAGLDVPAWTLNQLCGSAIMAVVQAMHGLEAGHGHFAVAGGFESVSNAPYLLPAARWGHRMGAAELIDPLLQDGPPWFSQIQSQQIIPANGDPVRNAPSHLLGVEIQARKGAILFEQDETCGMTGTEREGPPADGAAAVVLASETGAESRGPLARILGFSTDGEAAPQLASRAGLSFDQVHSPGVPDHLLAVGGAPFLVDVLHAPREASRRFPFLSFKTGDGQTLSLLLEIC